MSEKQYQERLTVGDRTVIIQRRQSPVDVDFAGDVERLTSFSVFDPSLRPENYAKADGSPLRLFSGSSVRVDLSKRSREDMGFWHRSADFNEIIFCVRGALLWETEVGTVTLRAGDMIWIPRGVAHRSRLCDESAEENVLLELKIAEDLERAHKDSAP